MTQTETDAIKWAMDTLSLRGYVVNNLPELVQKTPYSSVTRFSVKNGCVYLKQMPAALSLEPVIMQMLLSRFHSNVPVVIDSNKPLNCFLMEDCGYPLREKLKNNFQFDLLIESIKIYTHIQVNAAKNINEFIKIGMPDWGLNKLPLLYKELIDTDLLKYDGMTNEELVVLNELYPTFVRICELLSSYKIPETLNHCDFHDNNIVIDDKTNNLTIIDWGETVVSHPFFSLISFMTHSAFRYHFKEADQSFIALKDASIEDWSEFAEKNFILEILLLAKKIWPIYSALGYFRLIASSNMNLDSKAMKSYFHEGRNAGRLSRYVKVFIQTNQGLLPGDVSHVNLSDAYRPIQG